MSVMDYPYNLTRLGNVSSIVDMVTFGNEAAQGVPMYAVQVGFFLIVAIGLSFRYSISGGVMVASFVSFIITLLLSSINLANPFFSLVWLFLLGAGGLMSYLESRR